MTKLSGNVENFTFAVEGTKTKFRLAAIDGDEGDFRSLPVHADAGVRRRRP